TPNRGNRGVMHHVTPCSLEPDGILPSYRTTSHTIGPNRQATLRTSTLPMPRQMRWSNSLWRVSRLERWTRNMFGSLVIVFPTPHEGGALRLYHRGQEWIFDSDQALAAKGKPSIGYVTFFNDIEHEVTP
ncbi:hypothetical protein BJV77DRAFT_1037700, partial [Russula vinacea]